MPEKILNLAAAFTCEEIGIVTVTHRFTDRLDSYRLLAKVLRQKGFALNFGSGNCVTCEVKAKVAVA